MAAKPQQDHRQTAGQDAALHLERALLQARRVILWERIWPPLVGLSSLLAVFLLVSWSGLWLVLPPFARMAGVMVFALLLIWRGWALARVRGASRDEALARLDSATPLPHRPATSLSDTLATRPDDPVGVALWRAHMARILATAWRLSAGWPAPGMARRDPRALRALILLALVPVFFHAGGQHLTLIASAFDWRGTTIRAPYRLDAWVDPPAYTGRAPVVLPGLRSDDAPQTQAVALSVPVGSVLVVRMVGLDPNALQVDAGLTPVKPEQTDQAARASTRSGAIEQRFTIATSGGVTFSGPDQRVVIWRFQATPDTKPTISFVKDPQTGARNSLVLTYRIEDDYGTDSAQARFVPAPPERAVFARPDSPPPAPGQPLVAAPDFPLTLPAGGKSAAQTTKDLVAHPWAGTLVQVTLHVRDAAGHEADSDTRSVRLPARAFTHPLARALVEERRVLALDIKARGRVETVLSALTLAPDRFGLQASTYLGLRSAYWRLKNARDEADLRGVVDYLWEIALAIEDGTLSEAQRALKAAENNLREALDRGAGDEEIQQLMQDLRAAMDKMMRQMEQEAQRGGADDARPLDQNSRILRPQDLQHMMDRIENLARSGARDAARQMLDQLQAMMDNMRPGNRQAGNPGGQQPNELGRMIQEQQRLRDRTFQQQDRNGAPDQGAQENQSGAFGELQTGQEDLRRKLGRMLEDLKALQQGQGQAGQGQHGAQDPSGAPMQGQGGDGGAQEGFGRAADAFGRAEQAMRDAADALSQKDGEGAQDAQGRALQGLRQGARALAEAQQGADGQGSAGKAGGQGMRTDPMGRPLRGQDYGDDFSVKVPQDMDVQRARQVLEELRRRLEQTNRPRLELDYIERLLENF